MVWTNLGNENEGKSMRMNKIEFMQRQTLEEFRHWLIAEYRNRVDLDINNVFNEYYKYLEEKEKEHTILELIVDATEGTIRTEYAENILTKLKEEEII